MAAQKVIYQGGPGGVVRPLRRVWQWERTLPPRVTLIAWVLLAVVFGRTNFVVVAMPVVIGLWLWERIRPVVRRRSVHQGISNQAGSATRTDLWQWIRHLAQMVFAMYAGMTVYHLFIGRGFTGLGDGDLGYAGMMLSMLVPMVALMRFQGHSWRMTSEMAVGMTAPVVVCLALVRAGICPLIPFLAWLSAANVYTVAHEAMLLGMMAVMVYRRGMYAAAQSGARQTDECARLPLDAAAARASEERLCDTRPRASRSTKTQDMAMHGKSLERSLEEVTT